MAQGRVVERKKIIALIERDAREVFYVATQMLREIVQGAAGRANGRVAVFQAEAVERRDFEMLAHSVERGLGRECPIVVAVEDLEGIAEQITHGRRLARENDFRRS